MTKSLAKYVFIQNDPFYLPKVLDKYLREYADSTHGVLVQTVNQGNRSTFRTAWDLYQLYGLHYFSWKLRRYLGAKLKEQLFNQLFRSTKHCYSVAAVARKYDIPVRCTDNVNSAAFRADLRQLGVELIVSISGTQFYGKKLREQTPAGIINCHGALLPKYRGLMPSLWTLVNGEREGGVSVHFVDEKIDNGPIVVQRRYRINPFDTLEDIMSRSKDLAAEAIIEAVRLIETGDFNLLPNPESEATFYSMPTRADISRCLANGHRFF